MTQDQVMDSFMKKDFSKYCGEWVALSDDKVVARGSCLRDVLKKSRGIRDGARPVFTKIPEKDKAMLL